MCRRRGRGGEGGEGRGGGGGGGGGGGRGVWLVCVTPLKCGRARCYSVLAAMSRSVAAGRGCGP